MSWRLPVVSKSSKTAHVCEHWLLVFTTAAQKDKALSWTVTPAGKNFFKFIGLNKMPLLLCSLVSFHTTPVEVGESQALTLFPTRKITKNCTEHGVTGCYGLETKHWDKGVNYFSFLVRSLGLNESYCACWSVEGSLHWAYLVLFCLLFSCSKLLNLQH